MGISKPISYYFQQRIRYDSNLKPVFFYFREIPSYQIEYDANSLVGEERSQFIWVTNFFQAILNWTVLITSLLFFCFLILAPAFLRATQGTKG